MDNVGARVRVPNVNAKGASRNAKLHRSTHAAKTNPSQHYIVIARLYLMDPCFNAEAPLLRLQPLQERRSFRLDASGAPQPRLNSVRLGTADCVDTLSTFRSWTICAVSQSGLGRAEGP